MNQMNIDSERLCSWGSIYFYRFDTLPANIIFKYMLWSELKEVIGILFPAYIGSGKLIDDTDNGSTPSALASLVNLVNNSISSYPLEFNCLRETGTITLTGATTYNLKTLLPGLKTIYQVYGIDQYKDHSFFSNNDANITPIDGYTVRGDSLIFTGTAPSGTVTIQYKSKYLVKNTAGTRQQYFLADTDYSCLDEDDINVLIFGVGKYINWNSDSESQERKEEVKAEYKDAFNNLILNNKQSNQLQSLL
jgi:hypothetical protein